MAEGDSGAAGAAAALVTPSPPPVDVQAATARKAELMNSPEWREQYFSGSPEARSEMAGLNAALVAGASPEGPDALVAAFSVERAREFGVSDAVLDQVANRPPVSQEEYEMAARHKRSLLSDRSFVERLNNGDYDARRKMFLSNLILSSPIKPAA